MKPSSLLASAALLPLAPAFVILQPGTALHDWRDGPFLSPDYDKGFRQLRR